MQGRSQSRSSSQSSGRGQRDNGSFVEPNKRLFVCGINPETRRDDLKQLFETVAPVVDFFLKKVEDKDSIAFIEMGSLEESAEAISLLSGKMLNDKQIMVKYAKPRKDRVEGSEAPGRKERTQGRSNFNRDSRDSQGGRPNFGQRPGDREDRPKRSRDERGEEEGSRGGFGRQDRPEGQKGSLGEQSGFQKGGREVRGSEGGKPGMLGRSEAPGKSVGSQEFDY